MDIYEFTSGELKGVRVEGQKAKDHITREKAHITREKAHVNRKIRRVK